MARTNIRSAGDKYKDNISNILIQKVKLRMRMFRIVTYDLVDNGGEGMRKCYNFSF